MIERNDVSAPRKWDAGLNGRSRIAVFVATAAIAQVSFWTLSMPLPQILCSSDLPQSIRSCLIAALTLCMFPWIAHRFLLASSADSKGTNVGQSDGLRWPGFGWGDYQFGIKAIFWCAPTMLVGTWIGGSDPTIQDFYPLPGDQIGQNTSELLIWFTAYLVFYFSFEFFYRGFLLCGLGPLVTGETETPHSTTDANFKRKAWTMILIQAALCFLIHIGKPPAELIASLPASVLFGWIAWRSRSIWYGLAIHYAIGIVNDFAAMS